MRVLIADSFEQSGRDALIELGCDVQYEPKLKEQALVDAAKQLRPDVLIVRSTQVTEAVLDAQNLKLVVRAGAGYNTIDVAAASRRGIYVSNCPGKNAIAVAELAFGLILRWIGASPTMSWRCARENGIRRSSPRPAACMDGRWDWSASGRSAAK